jgi:hypothetical protein
MAANFCGHMMLWHCFPCHYILSETTTGSDQITIFKKLVDSKNKTAMEIK